MRTTEYAPGRLADLFGEPEQSTMLLWHGKQADARATVRLLAETLASHGFGIVTPDWNSDADDGGRADLLRSARFARDRMKKPDSLVLVGWSLGAVAAAGLTLYANRLGVGFAHTVCLAGAFTAEDPISGRNLDAVQPASTDRAPFTLLHGLDDDVVPVAASRDFAATLKQWEWPVDVVELDADQGSIAGAVYEPAADRYSVADDPETAATVADVAARIAAACEK